MRPPPGHLPNPGNVPAELDGGQEVLKIYVFPGFGSLNVKPALARFPAEYRQLIASRSTLLL